MPCEVNKTVLDGAGVVAGGSASSQKAYLRAGTRAR